MESRPIQSRGRGESAQEEEGIVLSAQAIRKTFPGVVALDDVSFDLRAGEVHALVGENGAGKSTLMKVLGGNHRPDSGFLTVAGERREFRSPHDARQAGIMLIYQELSLVPELSAAENIFLGALPHSRIGHIDRPSLRQQARRALDSLRSGIDPNLPVRNLSIAKQQMVEIARALAFNSRVVIFDEPTASLTDVEKASLFEAIHEMKSAGVSIIYISHKMSEIFDISDRLTVLRDGSARGTFDTAHIDEEEVTRLMIGRNLDSFFARSKAEPGREVLRVDGLSVDDGVEDVSFSIRAGEIVGMYGLVGAGRTEVAEGIFGIRPLKAGKVAWFDTDVRIDGPVDAMQLGIAYVPEDRKASGLVLGLGGRENVVLPMVWRLSRFGFSLREKELEVFEHYRTALDIKTTGPGQAVSELSGGNQQKYVIAKWLATNPKLLILDEPTRGIDIGAKAEIHKLIASLAESGVAVLVISSEMPEILGVCHRVLTMYDGRVTGAFEIEELTEEVLIRAVTKASGEMKTSTVGSTSSAWVVNS